MYVFQHTGQLSIEEIHSPFGGKLDPNNRWVLLHKLIPWIQLESHYAPQFSAKTAPSQALPDGIRSGVHPAKVGRDGSGDSGADHGITLLAIFHWIERLPATAAI